MIRLRSQASCSPEIFRGRLPPDLPGAQLPVLRRRCDHFTTLDGATSNAAATSRTVCPRSRRSIARSRRSIEIGLAIARAPIAALTDLNQIAAANGIPFRFNVMSFCSSQIGVEIHAGMDIGNVWKC